MEVLYYLTMVGLVFVAVLLILLILIQKGRGGGLSNAFGGGGGSTAFGAKTGDVLTWTTAAVFFVFMVLAIVQTLIVSHQYPSAPVAAKTGGATAAADAAPAEPPAASPPAASQPAASTPPAPAVIGVPSPSGLGATTQPGGLSINPPAGGGTLSPGFGPVAPGFSLSQPTTQPKIGDLRLDLGGPTGGPLPPLTPSPLSPTTRP